MKWQIFQFLQKKWTPQYPNIFWRSPRLKNRCMERCLEKAKNKWFLSKNQFLTRLQGVKGFHFFSKKGVSKIH